MSKLKILFIIGSLREGSYNKKLAHIAAGVVGADHDVQILPVAELNRPLMNQDIEEQYRDWIDGMNAKIASYDGIIVVTPEYNGSISSPLKNFVDWTSRTKKPAWALKPVLLMGASPGALGATRGLVHSRSPFEKLEAHVYPEMFGLPKAHEAFNEQNELIDVKTKERMTNLTTRFMKFVSQVSNTM